MSIERWVARCASLLLWQVAWLAHAQAEPARAALFKTAPAQTEVAQLAAAADPVLHAELDKVPTLAVVAQPALDLPSTQLALDCVGETAECLALVAERTQVGVLIAPSLARTDNAVVLSVLVYDPRRASPLQVVTRRIASAGDDAVLEAVPGLVRELFALPEPADATPEPQPVVVTVASPSAKPVRDPEPSLLVPLTLGAAGVVLLGAGIGLGVSAKAAESGYADVRVDDADDAKRALSRFDSASTQATLSTVLFALGGTAIAAGAVVFFVQRSGRRAPERARTQLSWGVGGLRLASTWD